MLLPTSRMLWLAGLLIAAAVYASFVKSHAVVWPVALAVVAVFVVVDVLLVFLKKVPQVERRLPSRFAAGVAQKVRLTIHNQSAIPVNVQVFDGVPEHSEPELLPWKGKVEAQRWLKTEYQVAIHDRGEATFSDVFLLLRSPLGLFDRRIVQTLEETVKVYPNYEPVVQYALLAMQHRQDQMGIVRKHRIGASREFHQLRDYHRGDGMAQVDWKSTARHRRLISRDYQEQRNQTLMLAIDSGRRLRAMDGESSQFDHALNAMLLVSYLALKQGDQVGIMSFGDEPRYLAPVKGMNGMSAILNHLYNYETTLNPTDYAEAAEQILIRQQRRALVMMITNIRGEDGEEFIEPLRRLRQKHLVLLASLREKSIDVLEEKEISTLDDALRYGSSRMYLSERELTLRNLNSHGVLTLDVQANELAISLANQYFDIKSMGAL